MTNSKLLKFLKTIDSTELKALSDFLKVAKGAKDVNILFNYLKKHHPVYPEKYVIKNYVANKIFPKIKNNTKKLDNAMVKFNQLLDKFFILQELQQSNVQQDFLYLKALRRRKLDNYFFRKADHMKEQWDKAPPAGLEHFHNEYKLIRIHCSHPSYGINTESLKGFKLLISSIDKYYFSVKLFWSLILISNENYFSNKGENILSERLLNKILKLANTKDIKVIPQINLLSLLLKSSLSSNFNDIQLLKDMFVKQIQLYDEHERSNIFTILESGYYKSDNEGIIQNLFELNCLKLDQNCILQGGYITYNRFSNIINIGVAAKQLEWTENFINEYIQYLPEEMKEDAQKISNSTLNFHKGEFKDALGLLIDVRYKNELFSLYGRSIQLQCSYELNDYDLFIGLSKSFSLYVNRNDLIANNNSEQFLNFINFTKKIFRIKNNPNIIEHSKLNKDLNNNTNIAYKSWLTEKLNELINIC